MSLFTYHNSPLGPLLLTGDRQSLTGIYLPQQKYYPALGPDWHEDPEANPFPETRTQLDDYFAGDRHSFNLPLAPSSNTKFGTCFAKSPTAKPAPTGISPRTWGSPAEQGPWGPPMVAIPCRSWCPATG
jgi:hypothetical protein